MRVLHCAMMDFWEPGVFEQMRCEQHAANSLDIPWRSRLFSPGPRNLDSPVLIRSGVDKLKESGSSISDSIQRVQRRIDYRRWIWSEKDNFDVLLVRYIKANPLQVGLFRRLSGSIFSVHHTLEICEMRMSSHSFMSVLILLERLLGRMLLSKVQGIIGVTGEICSYERARSGQPDKPIFVYPNGICLSQERTRYDRRGQVPEILFVASSFKPWQGLDLLMDSIMDSREQVVLHLVGRVDPKIHELVAHDCRVKVHGVLSSEEILKLSETCWIGLSTLALERNNMTQACPLKVREYLANGLPSYGSYTEAFPPNFEFYQCGPIDIKDMLDFAYRVRHCSKDSVVSSAGPYISKESRLQELYSELVNHMQKIAV